jgi:RHS repeat-associated protein
VFQAIYDTSDQTQPAAITESAGITENPNGTQHVPSTTHTFVHTELGISQATSNDATAAFVHDPKGLLTTLKGLDGNRYNAVTDYQGSVLALIDTNGNQAASYSYSPYGATTATGTAAAANPLRWLGQFQLDGGVYLLGYRYYNPSYERFTAPDPTGQERNPYAYASGDPINHADPTGAISPEATVGLALTIAGVLLGGGALAISLGILPFAVLEGVELLGSFLGFTVGVAGLALDVHCLAVGC